jgi:hypothetical protein
LSESKLVCYPLLEFVELDFDRSYIVDPLLPTGGIGLVHGKGSHGKTQWAFALMNDLTSGGLFLNRYPTREGSVLYLQFDMPETLFQERLQKALPAFSRPDRIHVVSHHKPIDITEDRYVTGFRAIVESLEPSLVIVDTLRKVHPFDENDNAVPSVVYAAWKEVAGKDTSVLIIHHDRKAPPATRGADTSDEEAEESFRGARAWIDDSDLGVRLKKRGDVVTMGYSKLRCAPQEPMVLRFNPKTLLIEPKPPETAREWALEIWRQEPGLEVNEWAHRVIAHAKCGRSNAYRVISDIVAEMSSNGKK